MTAQLIGVLNYTPDSFYDGGKHFSVQKALTAAQQLLDDGASYIDVGAEATNPFVQPITFEAEIKRLSSIVPALFKKFPGNISLDTYHPETLKWALQFGRPIINDVSGFYNPKMAALAAEHDLTCITGHLLKAAHGVPVRAHEYKFDSFDDVVAEMLQTAKRLEQLGIKKSNIILDPNIGFGKTMRLNWQLLEVARAIPDYPIMIGFSNKRFLGCDPATGKVLTNADELRYSAERNEEAARRALNDGATYLRVHAPKLYASLL